MNTTTTATTTTAIDAPAGAGRDADRFARQQDLVPAARLAGLDAAVIGVGAVGRQLAVQLACLGVPKLRLVDFDVVEPTNVTTQGYAAADVGRPKVFATADAVRAIDPSIAVEALVTRYRPALPAGAAVFCCVDSIAARAAVWKGAGPACRFWCDARMLGEVVRVLTAADADGRAYYPTTLFPAAEAEPGRCTARGAIYPAAIAAGLMAHQFARWLRGAAVDGDSTFNLAAAELAVAATAGGRGAAAAALSDADPARRVGPEK